MTQPGQPPYGPNHPGQGGSQPTSTYPTGAPGNPPDSGQHGVNEPYAGQPGTGQSGTGGPSGGYPDQQQGESRRGGRVKQGPGWFTYLLTLLAAIVAVAIAVFIAQNTDRTTIEFFGTSKSMSIATALGIALAAGFLIGLLLGLIPALKAKRELRQIRRGQR
jgi:uncharacterized integral membrane protein